MDYTQFERYLHTLEEGNLVLLTKDSPEKGIWIQLTAGGHVAFARATLALNCFPDPATYRSGMRNNNAGQQAKSIHPRPRRDSRCGASAIQV